MAISFNRMRRRWFRPQFGLRGLFLTLTAVSLWLGIYVHRARERQAAVRAIRQVNAKVHYSFQASGPNSAVYDGDTPSPLPRWLRTNLGDDFFYDVEQVDFFIFHWSSDINDELSARAWREIMPRLPALSRLKSLALKGRHLTDDAAWHIGDLARLENLYLEDACELTDASISRFGRLQRLTSLVVMDTRVTDASLRALGQLKLKFLALNGGRFTDAGLACLAGNGELESLALGGNELRVTDAGMASLAGLVKLEGLDLSGADLTSKGTEVLKRFSKLHYLKLANNRRLSDAGLVCLSGLIELKQLDLQNTGVTSNGLRHLKRMKKLQSLTLSDNPGITDDGIAYLGQLTNLQELNLSHTGVSFKAARHLAALPKLEELDLSENAGITREILPELGAFRALTELNLRHTRLSSSGPLTETSIKPLAKLRRLDSLYVAGTGADVGLIELALPKCLVIGSDATDWRCAGLAIGTDYHTLKSVASSHESAKRLRDLGVQVREPVGEKPGEVENIERSLTGDELFRATVDRMMALVRIETIDPELAESRPLVDAIASRLRQAPYNKHESKHALREFLGMAAPRPEVMRLFSAANSLVFADGFAEYLERLKREQQNWALTDVELKEQADASKYLAAYLSDAAERLRITAADSQHSPADAVRSIWQRTRFMADGTNAASRPTGGRN